VWQKGPQWRVFSHAKYSTFGMEMEINVSDIKGLFQNMKKGGTE
jgi:hypothetical protein